MEQEKGWGAFPDKRYGDIIHVYPIDETHSEKIGFTGFVTETPYSKCKCRPRVECNPQKGTCLIIHGAFDGREAMEEVSAILNT